MMSSNVALLHSNNCCVLEPAICEDLDLHVVIFVYSNVSGNFCFQVSWEPASVADPGLPRGRAPTPEGGAGLLLCNLIFVSKTA